MRTTASLLLLFLLSCALGAQELNPDAAAKAVMERTGAPALSVAVVRKGKPVFLKAYGTDPATTFAIGSVSKQFTAAAVLKLVEEGKLSLDDRVAKFFPSLTRAGDITVRQLLSMTSGYRDYWPQDYVMPAMLVPATPLSIVQDWAGQPLDFAPGTRWEYSNTNYVLAGLIVEKVAGKPLFDYLHEVVFEPLGMRSVREVDGAGFRRFAFGPPRPAPLTAPGWLYAMGGLEMTPEDLAKWNASLIGQTLLRPSSYQEMERDTLLADGQSTRYGLGVFVGNRRGHRLVSHGGEVSGYTTANYVFPDDGVAITVVANLDATDAPSVVAERLVDLVFPYGAGDIRGLLASLAEGKVDASVLTSNCQAYFSPEALRDYRASLGPLGKPTAVAVTGESLRGGMTYRGYLVTYPTRKVKVSTFVTPEGKFEQFLILPE